MNPAITLDDVIGVYEGPVGELWEMLMGEQIHVGGAGETDALAARAGFSSHSRVLDVCSALGGPARHLAKEYGCRVTGLDATQKMIAEAVRRTERERLSNTVGFVPGDALSLPFEPGEFDVVWGQDAWCYVADKGRLLSEACRVLRTGGTIAFTDWIQTGEMEDEELTVLNRFMAFPYLETLDGYVRLMKDAGFRVAVCDDLSDSFADACLNYRNALRNELRDAIIRKYGAGFFTAADDGLTLWVNAALEGKVGRGRFVGYRA